MITKEQIVKGFRFKASKEGVEYGGFDPTHVFMVLEVFKLKNTFVWENVTESRSPIETGLSHFAYENFDTVNTIEDIMLVKLKGLTQEIRVGTVIWYRTKDKASLYEVTVTNVNLAGATVRGVEADGTPHIATIEFLENPESDTRVGFKSKPNEVPTTANTKQEGGNHYKSLKIQPWDYITANNIPYLEGSAIKYLTRWKDKGGIEDLKKAKHFIEKLIELNS